MLQHIKTFVLSVFFALTLISQSYARNISIATLDWPPQISPEVPEQGLNTALVRAAFEAAGHNVNVSFMPWTRAQKDVLEGRADVAIGAYYTDQRAKDYYMSDVIDYVDVGLISRPGLGVNRYKSLEDLMPYRIGIARGYANSEEFDAANYLNKHQASTPTLNIRKLYRGRIDMVAMSFDRFRYEAEKEGFCPCEVEYVQPPLHREGLYIMVSRAISDGKEIVTDFNRGLRIIRDNGVFYNIVNRLR